MTPLLDACGRAGDARVEAAAEQALVHLGPVALPALVAALTDHDPIRRAEAAAALGDLADPGARRPLERALADPSPMVRENAAQSLVEIVYCLHEGEQLVPSTPGGGTGCGKVLEDGGLAPGSSNHGLWAEAACEDAKRAAHRNAIRMINQAIGRVTCPEACRKKVALFWFGEATCTPEGGLKVGKKKR